MTQAIRIEDDFEDVLSKAMRGHGLSVIQLAQTSGLKTSDLEALLKGEVNASHISQVASALDLDAEALIAMASQSWRPDVVLPEGVALYNTPFPIPGYEAMTVNSFLLYDTGSGRAAAIDTGANAMALLAEVAERGLSLEALFLTHTHRDHVAALDTICEMHPQLSVYTPALEPIAGAVPLEAGASLSLGALSLEVLLTDGHSPGGLSFRVEGLQQPVVFVGDAIFCLSMGKASNAFEQARSRVREALLSLDPETILCPGHGPMTCVREELLRNPFFAAGSRSV